MRASSNASWKIGADQAVGPLRSVSRKIGMPPPMKERAMMGRLVVVAVEQHEVALGRTSRGTARSCWTDEVPLSTKIGPSLRPEDRGGLLLGALSAGPSWTSRSPKFEHRIVEGRRGTHRPRRGARRRCGRSGCGCRRWPPFCGRGRSTAWLPRSGIIDQRAEETASSTSRHIA